MATFNGVYYDDRYSDVPPNMPPGALAGNKVRLIYDEYEATGEAIGSILNMGVKVGKNSRVMPESKVIFDALGASSTLKWGFDYDDDALSAAVATSTTGVIKLDDAADIDVCPYTVTQEANAILTTAGGTITGTIKMFLYITNSQ